MIGPNQFYSVVYADEKPTLLSVGAMREKLAAMRISLDAPLAKHALAGGALFAPDGHFRLATAENAALVAKPTHAAQALGEDGEPIPDVVTHAEMRALLQAGGVHLDSNAAKCVIRLGHTFITAAERHVRVAVDSAGAPTAAGKAPDTKATTLLDRVAALWCGDALANEPEQVTSSGTAAGATLLDRAVAAWCDADADVVPASTAPQASSHAGASTDDADLIERAVDAYVNA